MNTNTKMLQIRQLNSKLLSLKQSMPPKPSTGWIKSIRQVLGMTASQLSNRMGITQQAVQAFEKGEVHETITLAKLRKVAEAMGFNLVYAFVPEESIEKVIEQRARELAHKIVMRASQQMAMENQKISDEKIEHAVNERAAEYVRTVPKILWD